MAQQSARRGRKNQGFPQCLEHALGDLDPARELPYRPAADHRCTTGRTDGSIRLRATAIRKFSLAKKGASTDGKRTFGGRVGPAQRASRVGNSEEGSASGTVGLCRPLVGRYRSPKALGSALHLGNVG